MDPARTVSLVQHALILALSVASPALLASALAGLVLALLAAPLRLQDPSLVAVPRLVVASLVIGASASWGAGAVAQFARHVWASMPAWVA